MPIQKIVDQLSRPKPITDDTVALSTIRGGLIFSSLLTVLAAFTDLPDQIATVGIGVGTASITGGLGLAKGAKSEDSSAGAPKSIPPDPAPPTMLLDTTPPDTHNMEAGFGLDASGPMGWMGPWAGPGSEPRFAEGGGVSRGMGFH